MCGCGEKTELATQTDKMMEVFYLHAAFRMRPLGVGPQCTDSSYGEERSFAIICQMHDV